MKKILITLLLSVLALTNTQAKDRTNIEACKTYINEAKSFQSTMKSDKLYEQKLAFAKANVVANCGGIVSKKPYKVETFAKGLYKKNTASVNSCKTAITMAKSYDERVNKTPLIASAHKVNIVHNCGTLVAKKAPEFTLFGVVDNSTEKLKERCIASIKKAHKTMGTSADFKNKGDVLRDCGRLHATI